MALPRKLYSAGRNLRRDTPQARKGTCYYADFRVAGVRHRPELGVCSHAEALERLGEAIKKAKADLAPVVPSVGPYKLREAQASLAASKPRLADETKAKYAQADTRALEWFGEEVFLEAVTRDQVDTWLEHRGEDVGPATQNRDLKRLRQVCSWAVEHGWLARNPTVGIPLYREPEHEIVPLTPEELARLELECEPWLWDMARFAMLTGLRRSEQLRLRWSWIRSDQLRVDPDVAKSRKARVVVLPPAALEILVRARVGNSTPLVFPTEQGHVWNPSNLMHDHWRPAVRAAGLFGVTWHRLRHEYASKLVAGGVSDHAVMTLAGWTSGKLLRRYAHLSPEYLRDAVKVLT